VLRDERFRKKDPHSSCDIPSSFGQYSVDVGMMAGRLDARRETSQFVAVPAPALAVGNANTLTGSKARSQFGVPL
jgi:hypothetical protein